MKKFIENYLTVPIGILAFILIAPTVMMSGFIIAAHIFGVLPDMGICQKAEKVKQ